jgi:hypothetical protein
LQGLWVVAEREEPQVFLEEVVEPQCQVVEAVEGVQVQLLEVMVEALLGLQVVELLQGL